MMDLKGKRLLILGGARLSCEIIKHARAMGIVTAVTDFYPLEKSPAKQAGRLLCRAVTQYLLYCFHIVPGWAVSNTAVYSASSYITDSVIIQNECIVIGIAIPIDDSQFFRKSSPFGVLFFYQMLFNKDQIRVNVTLLFFGQ